MSKILDTVLLLALPASGKSEVRKYLAHLTDDQCRQDFRIGPTVQLDDYPYVHLMRRVDDELARLGQEGVYFQRPDRPFRDPWDWVTLIELLNEDYANLRANRKPPYDAPAEALFARFDAAARKAGARVKVGALPPDVRTALAKALDPEARKVFEDLYAQFPETLEGRTIVIEFARGGADGSTMPLAEPFGYAGSLKRLSPELLERASILYIWVTPEESRRKNYERTDPNDPGSILNHGVPIAVMMEDYGCDDMAWLLETSDRKDTTRIEAHGRTFYVPLARVDNRVDKTTFVRGDVKAWDPDKVRALHEGLRGAFNALDAARG